ncbi:YchJ family metal-binding protein [Polaromonas sp.]|uniref:YchJ family protein n=1 Tax=Polaromonas sp. TaxID=1869339 RepID=UPI00326536B1
MAACPCGRADARGRPLAYAACCGRFVDHFAQTPAPDAEALMRSRYSAFVFERADYLRATWHTSRRPSDITFDPGVKWLGLEVLQHQVPDTTHAEVEFVARQKGPGSPAVRLHERSRFVLEAGRWYYVDGDQL